MLDFQGPMVRVRTRSTERSAWLAVSLAYTLDCCFLHRIAYPSSRFLDHARQLGETILLRPLGSEFTVEPAAAHGARQRVTIERRLEINVHGVAIAALAHFRP